MKASKPKPTVKTKPSPKNSGMASKKQPMKNPMMTPTAGHPDANTQASNIQNPLIPGRAHPLVPMSPALISSIRRSGTGQVPPALKKWMAAHGKAVK